MGTETERADSRFVITPNCSMSWRANQMFVASLAVISFGIAGVFALQGLWLILPFVGFEIALLAFVMYWCCLRSTRREVISIDADNIQIEVGRDRVRESRKFQRAWTDVQLYPPQRRGRNGRLVMRSKGVEVEVGACLSEQDRESLATSIKRAITAAASR